MPWQVRRADVDFFLADLWKDLRPFPRKYDPETFAKECFEPAAAMTEAATLLVLRDRLGARQFPRPVAVRGTVLLMEQVRGARFFDLIRHLKDIERERNDGVALDVLAILLDRARQKLRQIQLELFNLGDVLAQEPYPLEPKLKGLLDLFIRIMDLNPPGNWLRSLGDFVDYWEAQCVVLPFRDATTKNTIIKDDRLSLSTESDDSEASQRQNVRQLLDTEPRSYWQTVDIVDIDFTSVAHKTSPEDDPISLLCHEWTYGSVALSPKSFVLDPSLGSADDLRCAATFFVRYLRFGGRKLAYKLINAQGFRVRFAFDDPLFYFAKLPEITRSLSLQFSLQFEPLLELIELIAQAGRSPSQNDLALMSLDHLRRYYPGRQYTYWQQNPMEGAYTPSVQPML